MEKVGELNNSGHFISFLNGFCEKLKDKDDGIDHVPIRIANPRITSEELEGECLDWCLNFLSTRECPDVLRAYISHEVYDRVSGGDLDPYLTSPDTGRIHTDRSGSGDNGQDIQKHEENQVKEYSAEKLHEHAISVLEEVCQSWLTDFPELRPSTRHLEASYHAIKNTRRKMEDSHIIVPDLNSLFGLKDMPDQSFFGVFDGHAGTEASLYTSKHIHCNMVRHCNLDTTPDQAVKTAFNVTDQHYIPKAKRERWRSGSTGVTALVQGDKLHMSWLGDSQAVLVRDGQAVTHMEPHKPDRQDERDRIEAQGGFVMLMGETWRVGGNIAVSRAIGDVQYKPFISSEAEVISVDLDGTEDYLVLACDGLWDVVMEEDLPRLIYDHLIVSGGDRSTVARYLVQYAKLNESMDNISVIVVFFRENVSEPKTNKGLFNFTSGDSQGANQSGREESDGKGNNSDQLPKEKGDNYNTKGNHSGGDFPKENCSITPLKKSEIMWNHINPSFKQSAQKHVVIPSLEDVPLEEDVDLDYYGVFDARVTDVAGDQNSSYLLKNIADKVYHNKYSSERVSDELMDMDASLREKMALFEKRYEQQQLYRSLFYTENGPDQWDKQKKAKLPKQREKYNKKGLASSPICWAFTGKNKVRVQNHRLNRAAKTVTKGTTLTPGEARLAARAPPSLPDNNLKFAQHYASSENVNVHTASNVPLSHPTHQKLDSLPPPRQKLLPPTAAPTTGQQTNKASDIPGLTVFGSKNNIQTDTQKFHTTWRPRKPLKPISSIVYEMPPTPFINYKLSGPRQP